MIEPLALEINNSYEELRMAAVIGLPKVLHLRPCASHGPPKSDRFFLQPWRTT